MPSIARMSPNTLSFASLLSESKRQVEIELGRLLDARRETWANLGPEVRSVVGAATDLTMRGGKRFRAALLAAVHTGLVGKWTPATTSGGVALELLQSYLLIQDDWMDGDVERRGGPSAHVLLERKLGSSQGGAVGAMLASDFLAGLAFESLALLDAPPDRRVAALRVFAKVHEDVVMGQVLDTLAKKARVEDIHTLKTGSYTIRGPLLLGAALGGASTKLEKQLVAYAEPLGIAFQLRDDLLGIFGDEASSGRPRASDIRSGKNSAVMREADKRLTPAGKKAIARVFGKSDPKDADLDRAIDALVTSGARAAVEKRFFSLCDDASAKARSIGKGSPIARHLGEAVLLLRDLPILGERTGTKKS